MLKVGSPKSHAFDSKVQLWVTVMIYYFGALLDLGHKQNLTLVTADLRLCDNYGRG